jgi:hypothetical protein
MEILLIIIVIYCVIIYAIGIYALTFSSSETSIRDVIQVITLPIGLLVLIIVSWIDRYKIKKQKNKQ